MVARLLVSVTLIGFVAVGCGTEAPDDHQPDDNDNESSVPAICDPGDTRSCSCDDGRQGTQTCRDDGHGYQDCDCTPDTTELTTLEPTAVGMSSATLRARFDEIGEPTPATHGFCWSTSPEPSLQTNCTEADGPPEVGEFSLTVDELSDGTDYYVRAFAAPESGGPVFGEDVQMTTDPCDPGRLEATTCRPDGDALPLAEVVVEGTDCQGDGFETSTVSDTEGEFSLDSLPPGTHEMSYSSGSFEFEPRQVDIAPDEMTELPHSETCLESDAASIAVTSDSFDQLENRVEELDLEFEKYINNADTQDFLGDQDAMLEYDIIVAGSGHEWSYGSDDYEIDDFASNLRHYVQSGGHVYISELNFELVERSFGSQVADFESNGESDTATATVVVDELRERSGLSTLPVDFGFPGWPIIKETSSATETLLEADVESRDEQLQDIPLMIEYTDPVGEGQLVYTPLLHTNNHATDEFLEVFEAVLFRL